MECNNDTPIWQLTIGEFLEFQKTELIKELSLMFAAKNKKYEYGINGLAKLLGCSRTTASKIKSSGVLDEAIFQVGKTIIIDKEKALELFNNNNSNKNNKDNGLS